MCDPVSAVAAGSAIVGYMGQQEQASANAQSQMASYNAQMQQTQLMESQINQQASDQMSARAAQAQASLARLRVGIGENGGGGNSATQLENSTMFSSSQDIAALEANRASKIQQAQMGARGIQAQTQSALNAVPQPNALGTALQIGGITYAGLNPRSGTPAGVQTGGK